MEGELANRMFGDTLRILLISTMEGARDLVEEALDGKIGEHQLYWVSQPDLAPVRTQDLFPHVILIDDTLGGANPVSLIRQLTARVPGAAILAMVEADDIGQAQVAVLAGARGFVTKPLHTDDLAATLRQVVAPQNVSLAPGSHDTTERADGSVIIFCAPKGGTGRTTLAINTTVSLRMATRAPVVLVDADYAAPALDVALNLDAEHDVSHLLPRLSRMDEDVVSEILATHASGIRVLLAPPPANLTNPTSLPQVQQILVLLKRMFPWVIIDLGLPLDEKAFAFLDGADRIVMTVLPEMVGLRNTRLMLEQLRERAYPDDKLWLVLNRATMRGGVAKGDIEERLRVQVKHAIPDDQPLATHSINRGVPLVMSHRRSAVARAVSKLAQRLVEDLQQEADPSHSASGGLFGRVRSAIG
jgi:pilus assembly protein CpaE